MDISQRILRLPSPGALSYTQVVVLKIYGMILVLILSISIFWGGWTATCLASNYAKVRRLGVPIILIPISTMNVLWIIIQPFVIALFEFCFGSSKFTRFGTRDWHFREKARHHIEFGDVWALVTPGQVWLHVANPDTIVDIFQRRTQFTRPVELYQMLNVFGHNAATVGWTDWKRHRKIIAAPFNERTNHLVWNESLRQARDMIKEWTRKKSKETLGLQKDTRTLTLNVLAATGFRRSVKFQGSSRQPGDDEILGYREALATIMDNALFMMLVPSRILCSPLVPQSWAKVGQATTSFKKYMLEMLDQEKSLAAQEKSGASHLTSALLRASEEYSQYKSRNDTKDEDKSMVKGLTVEELLGNIFLINFAGHDTTANTLAYAIVLLAANPQVQDWIAEEVRAVAGNDPNQRWEYEYAFPLLKRSLAVMVCNQVQSINCRSEKLSIHSMRQCDFSPL